MRRSGRHGFTLVELLAVIGILLLLIALLLPAIQKVREAANKVVCADHLRKVGKALKLYLANNSQYYPTGGGDNPLPRTIGRNGVPSTKLDQDWGWMYQVLPYMEQGDLWKLRVTNPLVPSKFYGLPEDTAADLTIQSTPIPEFFCPTRRAPEVIPTPEAGMRAMNDYVGNIGAYSTYDEKDKEHSPCANADGFEIGKPEHPFRNGVFIKSRYIQDKNPAKVDTLIHVRDIKDGFSNTLMISEKRMKTNWVGKPQFGDYDGYVAGYIADTLRSGWRPPARDFEGEKDQVTDRFGSSHPTSMNALFCDGSVRQITYDLPDNKQVVQAYHPYLFKTWGILPLPDGPPAPTVPHTGPYPVYSIELTLFQRLCHRSDGGTIDMTLLE
jgi:prepilin-type N-terminal cleavage/methylation domain-containing protein/prepilin-type processing-associated H-X9-DG protein